MMATHNYQRHGDTSSSSATPTRISIQQSLSLCGIALLTIVMLPRIHELFHVLVPLQMGKIAIVLSLILVFTSTEKHYVPWLRLPQVRLLLCFVAWMFLSAVFGAWPTASLQSAFGYLKTILFFYLFLKSIHSVEDLYKLIWILLLSMMFFDACIIFRAGMERSDAGGLTLDPNESALLIAMTMPFFYYYFKTSKGLRRLTLLSGMALGVLAIFHTGSRGGVISLGVVFIYVYFTAKGSLMKKIILVTATILFIVFVMPQDLTSRFSRLGDESQDYNYTSRYGRIMIWKRAVSIIKEHPIFGVGMNNFGFVESEVNNQSRGMVAHNFVLQAAAELGIPGGGFLLSIFFISWRKLRFLRKMMPETRGSPTKAVISSVECAWVVFFVGGQFLAVAFSSQIVFLAACSSVILASHLHGDFDATPQAQGEESAYVC